MTEGACVKTQQAVLSLFRALLQSPAVTAPVPMGPPRNRRFQGDWARREPYPHAHLITIFSLLLFIGFSLLRATRLSRGFRFTRKSFTRKGEAFLFVQPIIVSVLSLVPQAQRKAEPPNTHCVRIREPCPYQRNAEKNSDVCGRRFGALPQTPFKKLFREKVS